MHKMPDGTMMKDSEHKMAMGGMTKPVKKMMMGGMTSLQERRQDRRLR
jgi:hypothetical protein